MNSWSTRRIVRDMAFLRRLSAWMVFLMPLCLRGVDAGGWSRHATIQGAVIPIYAGESAAPAGICKVKRIRQDYQRHGFFRIGLLPLVVLEGISIQINPEQLAGSVFSRLQSELERFFSHPAYYELRKIRIQWGDEVLLTAGQAQINRNGDWQLSNRVVVHPGRVEMSAREALLIVQGPQAGQLRFLSENNQEEIVVLYSNRPPSPRISEVK